MSTQATNVISLTLSNVVHPISTLALNPQSLPLYQGFMTHAEFESHHDKACRVRDWVKTQWENLDFTSATPTIPKAQYSPAECESRHLVESQSHTSNLDAIAPHAQIQEMQIEMSVGNSSVVSSS